MTSAAESAGRRHFSATRWSVVLAAADESGGACDALATLWRSYWYPLYAFVRRQGISSHDAEDLTQRFFQHDLKSQISNLR